MTTLNLSVGKGIIAPFDTAKIGIDEIGDLHPVHRYLIDKVLVSTLMDSHAGISVSDLGFEEAQKQSRAIVEKKVESLYNGEVRVGGGGRTTDPVESRMWDIVEPSEKAKLKQKYGAVSKAPKGELDKNVQATIDKNRDSLYALAKKQIDEAAALSLTVEI